MAFGDCSGLSYQRIVPDSHEIHSHLFQIRFVFLICRKRREDDQLDMEECSNVHADLTLEVLTRKMFRNEFRDDGVTWPENDNATHALVIYYGCRTHYAFIGQTECTWLRNAFGSYVKYDTWKTHYFRFKAESLYNRLIVPQ